MVSSSPIVLARFDVKNNEHRTNRVGIVDRGNNRILDITGMKSEGEIIRDLGQVLNWTDRLARLRTLREQNPTDKVSELKHEESADGNPSPSNEPLRPESRVLNISEVKLLAPVPDTMPVWAAGVTYKKSADGRNEEQGNAIKLSKPRAQLSNPAGLTAYDMIYAQDPEHGRPEIFYKAEPGTAAATGEAVTIRPDSELDVPEPELVLVFNSTGKLVGYTMGNDMSSRDIEGQNPLYLPQAKVYYRSTALGPFLYLDDEKTSTPGGKLGDGVKSNWKISMKVFGPGGQVKFEGETELAAIKNTFENLKDHLQKYQNLKNGAALFTGTGILPPNNFKLEEGDTVKMTINEIGTLENRVVKTPEVIDADTEKTLAQAQFI